MCHAEVQVCHHLSGLTVTSFCVRHQFNSASNFFVIIIITIIIIIIMTSIEAASVRLTYLSFCIFYSSLSSSEKCPHDSNLLLLIF